MLTAALRRVLAFRRPAPALWLLQTNATGTMGSREIPNPFPDYRGEKLLGDDGKLDKGFSEALKTNVGNLLSQLETGLPHTKRGDYSVYTGQTGIAYLYLHLHKVFGGTPGSDGYLDTALGYLAPALQHLNSGVYTFLCGDAGVLALAAVAFARHGNEKSSHECIVRLEKMHAAVCTDKTVPDEHLYGRAGYLSALMFVQSQLGEDAIHAEIIVKVVKEMLASGQALAKKKGWTHPLMYAWYREYYLGAAHGLAGIFYTLLLVKDPEVRTEIESLMKPSIDYMLTLQFPSGNFPAVVGDADDRLVHWCHGAPGWVSMFVLAYETYNDKRYLEAAERCCEVAWKRGLLKKGYGLCHGAAGNAYAFLAMFRLTKNQKYLYRACKFAEWCFDYGKHGCRIPDHPLSMYEGMAGTIYFLADLLDPLNARFPAYEYDKLK